SKRSGNGADWIQPRISAPTAASRSTSSTSRPASACEMRCVKPFCSRKSRYASAVVAKPFGTEMPSFERWLIISPSDEFLPPTISTSSRPTFSKGNMYVVKLVLVMGDSIGSSVRTDARFAGRHGNHMDIFSTKPTVLPLPTRNESRKFLRQRKTMQRRTIFFVSDQTGVTAETMGHSLLTQFDGVAFRQVTLPF